VFAKRRSSFLFELGRRHNDRKHRGTASRGRFGFMRKKRPYDVCIKRFVADQKARTGVREQRAQLALAIHWIDQYGNHPELPGGDERNHELGNILQIDRDAVAALAAAHEPRARERVGLRVQFRVAQRTVEVENRRML
jgi:hypothetical protein